MIDEPVIGESITIDGKSYAFTEAPNAPGILYAEIGRKARVYRVTSAGQFFALKTFKARYRSAETVENTGRITAFQDVPGLSVARRTILTPEKYPDIIKKHEDFAYAVLMPWAEGKSWFNFVTGKVALSRQESLHLARALANAMRELEQRALAHCDLSSSNFIFSPDFEHVELIDIEDMFGHGLIMPSDKPRGTGGYAPDWVKKDGIWEAGADRFSTGILLSEILAWQFDDIRAESAGDAFFAEGEFGHKSKRFRMMSERLEQIHPELSRLFKTVWYAESVEECPRVADWKRVLEKIREPELQVIPVSLEFGNLDLTVKPAIQPKAVITIINRGGGVLIGKVDSNVPWLSVTPVDFTCSKGGESHHEVSLGRNAPVKKGQKSYSYPAGLVVRGGDDGKQISVSYTAVMPGARLPWWGIVLGALLITGISISGIMLTWGGFCKITQCSVPGTSVEPTIVNTREVRQINTSTPASTHLPTSRTTTPPSSESLIISPIDGMPLVLVPAGEFLMGMGSSNRNLLLDLCPVCPMESLADAQPQRSIIVDTFMIDQHEVTNRQFSQFIAETGYVTTAERTDLYSYIQDVELMDFVYTSQADWQHPQGFSSSIYGKDENPVTQVSWQDARAYCEWAGRRLPTEAEWEKAARGRNGQLFPWGDAPPNNGLLNYNYINTGPVKAGSYPSGASPYGILDMAGNLWEWVGDYYSDNYYQEATVDNPTGPSQGDGRLMRGGSWASPASSDLELITTFFRLWNYEYISSDVLGIRCALTP